jgi:DNA-binding transcriptional LysR family regulator
MSWNSEDDLLSEKIDLAFTYIKPDNKKIEVRHIELMEMAIIAPKAWESKLKSASLNRLTTFPWVWTSDHCPLRALQNEIFTEAGCQNDKSVVVDQEAAIHKLVSEGVGLSIMPVKKAVHIADNHNLVTLRKLTRKLPLFLVYLKRREQEQRISILLSIISQVWRTINPAT